jgi:hypothetical protein
VTVTVLYVFRRLSNLSESSDVTLISVEVTEHCESRPVNGMVRRRDSRLVSCQDGWDKNLGLRSILSLLAATKMAKGRSNAFGT